MLMALTEAAKCVSCALSSSSPVRPGAALVAIVAPLVRKALIDGVAEEAGRRSIADLQRWRDRKLIEFLKVAGEP